MDGVIAELAAHPIANSALCEAGSLEFSPGSVRLCLVPVAEVAGVVGEVAQWIEAAMRSAPSVMEPLERVMERLEAGRYRLMLAGIGECVMAAAVLERTEIRGRGCLFIVAAGGAIGRTFSTVAPVMWRGILAMARELGVGVSLAGRPGWARWCQRQGGAGCRVKVTQILLDAEVS